MYNFYNCPLTVSIFFFFLELHALDLLHSGPCISPPLFLSLHQAHLPPLQILSAVRENGRPAFADVIGNRGDGGSVLSAGALGSVMQIKIKSAWARSLAGRLFVINSVF